MNHPKPSLKKLTYHQRTNDLTERMNQETDPDKYDELWNERADLTRNASLADLMDF